MFTNKEINTIKGLLYAASCVKNSTNPVDYRQQLDNALEYYFTCYPNDDENSDTYQSGDFPEDE